MHRIAPALIGLGIALAVVVGLTLSAKDAPAPSPNPVAAVETRSAAEAPAAQAPAVQAPAEAPVTPAEAPATPAAEPANAPDPAEAAERARWEERLSAVDALLVEQAVAAGCDPERAEVMRQILADHRAARARTTRDFEDGAIDGDELARQAVAAQQTRDDALAQLLEPAELAALDPGAARAAVTARDHGTD